MTQLIVGLVMFYIGMRIWKRAMPKDDRYAQLEEQYRELLAKSKFVKQNLNTIGALYESDKHKLEALVINSELNDSILKDVVDREARARAYLRMTLLKYGVEPEEVEAVLKGIEGSEE